MSIEAGARIWLLLGAVNGFLSVSCGAFAAHALKARLDAHWLAVFDKGVDYQGMHALALLATGLLLLQRPGMRMLVWAGGFFAGGILLFSGSLYLLALTQVRAWGMVTPVGGVAFLLGWLCLAWAAAWLPSAARRL